MPEYYDEKGVPMVLTNTSKGQSFFDKATVNVSIKPSTKDAVYNDRLKSPVEPNPQNERFYAIIVKKVLLMPLGNM